MTFQGTSGRDRGKGIKEYFSFGIISLSIVVISLFFTLFYAHPSNSARIVAVASYLLTMGIVSMIVVLFFVRGESANTTPERRMGLLGFYVAFLFPMGLISLVRLTGSTAFDAFFVNDELATLSSVTLPVELLMLFVATIEELAFRIALPLIIMFFLPKRTELECASYHV